MCIEETLEAIETPFFITSELNLQGYEKLFKKMVARRYLLDEKPREESLPEPEEFERCYPELGGIMKTAEILAVCDMMEEADKLGGNALIGINIQINKNREKQICLNVTARIFRITPIEKEGTLTEEKFQKIYKQVEIEYKNRNLNKDICYGMKNYNMAMRLAGSLDSKDINLDIIKLTVLLYGINETDFKLLSYYGDPEFQSAEEYLEYQGVPEKLCHQVQMYLVSMDYSNYNNFKSFNSDMQEQISPDVFESIEWKVLRDMLTLLQLGALGIADVIRYGGVIYDPWFSWLGDLDECYCTV